MINAVISLTFFFYRQFNEMRNFRFVAFDRSIEQILLSLIFPVIYKLGDKVPKFLNLTVTPTSFSTSIINDVKDNKQASQAFSVKH